MTRDAERFAIAITGANGYIGRRLVERALQRGYAVYALGRRPLSHAGVETIAFDLLDPRIAPLPAQIGALVHLAAETAPRPSGAARAEIVAAEALAAALPTGARFLFVSSQSARSDAASEYGRRKWAIERAVKQRGGVCVRPGLVYGGPECGLYGRICEAVRRLPLLPLFVLPRPITQPIHVDDLAEALLRVVEREWRAGAVVKLGQPEPIPFDQLLRSIAGTRLGLRRGFIPIPLGLATAALSRLARILQRDLNAGQLAALAQTKPMSTAGDLARLDLSLRPLTAGLSRPAISPRKQLADEGTRLLAYILGEPPQVSLVRRYVRTIERCGAAPLVVCRGSLRASNLALALLDRRGAGASSEADLGRRLDLALRIAEASPQSFGRFIGDGVSRPRPLRAALTVGRAIGREVLVRAARPVASGVARRHLMPQGQAT